ncbi:MAG: NYN domain-containing protein [Acidobacteria bacterium]|nr:NYN domain-containing protein [Acidobacteriota bacterium]MCI0666219.1 NYN domain-containing protein [Acidobacteriota bacterium]
MYLIDGNNVIGQRVGWHRDKPGSRRRLLEELARFIRVKKAHIIVIFDGVPDKSFPDGSSYRGVKIFYARENSDADSRIVEMVEAEKNRKGLTVVTSDRELAARVRVCGVRVMRSGELRRMLDEISNVASDEDELTPEAGDLDGWLRYFGMSKEDNEE